MIPTLSGEVFWAGCLLAAVGARRHASMPLPASPLQRSATKAGARAADLPGCHCRLHDVIHSDRKLYLVFEFLDLDLKRLMDTTPDFHHDMGLIKVGLLVACEQQQCSAS